MLCVRLWFYWKFYLHAGLITYIHGIGFKQKIDFNLVFRSFCHKFEG